MHVRLKRNRSGSISVIVVDKSSGRYKELHTVGIAKDESEITLLRQKGLEWIRQRELEMHPELDLYGEERRACESEIEMTERVVSNIDGYPLAYCIHEGNKYEGHTMLPVIREFVSKYQLDDFIVVADSGLMTGANINDLEADGCKYIIGGRIKNEAEEVKRQILSFPKVNGVLLLGKYKKRVCLF